MTKHQFRRAWFQVHKWIGLILAALIIPLSLSGALLVWDRPVDRLLNPARYATTGAQLLPPHVYVEAARAALGPGHPIVSLVLPQGSEPVIVQASMPEAKRGGGPPARVSVWLDPPTAAVLDVADSRSGALRIMHRLHGSLLVPGIGRKIVGWIGVTMMLSCFTGLWLWWPTVGKWARGLRWRRHRNFDTNLHHLIGFWIALPLFVLSLTGAWISFPGLFGGGRSEGPPRPRLAPVAEPAMTVDAILAAARRSGAGEVRSIAWPLAGERSAWTVAAGERAISIDDRTGVISPAPVRPHGGPGVAGAMRRIHDGEGMGLLWQVIIFLGGVIPVALAVTGATMWWRARSWRGALKRRAQPGRRGAEARTS